MPVADDPVAAAPDRRREGPPTHGIALIVGGNTSPVEAPVLRAGLAVRGGRVGLIRLRWALGEDPLLLAVGLRSGCWIGNKHLPVPELGRLHHTSPVRLDTRGRVRLDRNALGYLGPRDPQSFDVVVVAMPAGGVLLVPGDGIEDRIARVHPAT